MVVKVGRPASSSPKNYMLHVRLDKEMLRKLDKCCKAKQATRSEVVRNGIEEQYDRIKK